MGSFTLMTAPPCRLARERPQLVDERVVTREVELSVPRVGAARRIRGIEAALREGGLEVASACARGRAVLTLTGPQLTVARAYVALEQHELLEDVGEGHRLLAEAKRGLRARHACGA